MNRTPTITTMVPRSSKPTIGDADDFNLFRGAAEMLNALGGAIQQATTTTTTATGPQKVNACHDKATIESNIEVGYAVWASCAFSDGNFDPEVSLKGNDSFGFDVNSESFNFGPFQSKEDALRHLSREPSWRAINSSKVQDIISGLREAKIEKEAANFNPFKVLDKEQLNELVALVEPDTEIGTEDSDHEEEEKAGDNQDDEATLDLSTLDESRTARSRANVSMDRSSRRSRSASRSRAASQGARTTTRPAGLTSSVTSGVSPIPRSRPRRTMSRGLSPRRSRTLEETIGSNQDTTAGCSDCTVQSEPQRTGPALRRTRTLGETIGSRHDTTAGSSDCTVQSAPKPATLSLKPQARRICRVNTIGSNSGHKGPALRRTRTLGETIGSHHDTTAGLSDCTVQSAPKPSSLSAQPQARRICRVNTIGSNNSEQKGPALRRTRTLGETIGSKNGQTGRFSDCTVQSAPKPASLSPKPQARRICRVNTFGSNDSQQKAITQVCPTKSRKASGPAFRRTKTQGDTPTRFRADDISRNSETDSNKRICAEDGLPLSNFSADKGDSDHDDSVSSFADDAVCSPNKESQAPPPHARSSVGHTDSSFKVAAGQAKRSKSLALENQSAQESSKEDPTKKRASEKKKRRSRSPTKDKMVQSSSSHENTQESKQRKEIRELYEVGTPIHPLEQMYPPELVQSVVEEMEQNGFVQPNKEDRIEEAAPSGNEEKTESESTKKPAKSCGKKDKKEKCTRKEERPPPKRVSNGQQAFKRNKSADDATFDMPKKRTSNSKRNSKQGDLRKSRSEEPEADVPEKRDSTSMLQKMKELCNRREELQRKADSLRSSTKKSIDELGQQSLHALLDMSQSSSPKRLSGGSSNNSSFQSLASLESSFEDFAGMDPSDRRWMTVKLSSSLNSSSDHQKQRSYSSLSPIGRKTLTQSLNFSDHQKKRSVSSSLSPPGTKTLINLKSEPRISLSLSPRRESSLKGVVSKQSKDSSI